MDGPKRARYVTPDYGRAYYRPGYRQWIWNGGPIPRSTAYRARKALGEVNSRTRKLMTVAQEQMPQLDLCRRMVDTAMNSYDRPLFENSRITVNESVALLIGQVNKHPTINKSMSSDIIYTLKCHLSTDVKSVHLDSMHKF